ncbi:SDR family oxidoreductase [Mangrovimicrobium sediminis]|uniref:SDR family oxidoreductase n=1 Tax=Mangrovimicrobium sediminis TaxID=2562682 RepID=A0A4Z0LWI7_9GAMM|nr:SDR family oxidoreductase [Haliea sp. SAOS-164]
MLVTGASGAIGGEIARRAAALGYRVGAQGAHAQRVEQAAARIAQATAGAQVLPLVCDFRDEQGIERMVEAVVEAYGQLDYVVHCAVTGAPGVTGVFANTTPPSYGEHAALVMGSFQRLCHAALPHLAQSGGAIVAFASDAARFAAPRQALIGAAFAGVLAFARNLAVEAARDGVRINCITPSFVERTPAFDKYAAGGRGESARQRAGLGLPGPEDIAPLALFLCSAEAAKITGQVISVNGGLNA